VKPKGAHTNEPAHDARPPSRWALILTAATGNEDALNAHPLNQRGLPTARRAPVPRWAMVPVL
jgi:hypothetical protein